MIWPQVAFICFTAASFGVNLGMHGKPKGDYNVFLWSFAAALEIWIVWEGGFFAPLFRQGVL